MNPDVGVYETTPDNNCIWYCLINQRFQNIWAWLKSELWWTSTTQTSNSVC